MKINLKTIPTINMEATGKRIQQLREEHGYNKTSIAKAVPVSVQAVCKWEKGKSLPTIDNAVILTELFGVTLDELYVLNEPRPDGDDPDFNKEHFEFVSQRMAG